MILLGLTVLPVRVLPLDQSGNGFSASGLETANMFTFFGKRLLADYLHCTGIEGGYGFFAPNFSAGYQLTFELHYSDGRVDTELPRVRCDAAGLRITSLLDRIGQEESEKMREVLIRLLVLSEYKLHPEVDHIRAIFESVSSGDSTNRNGVSGTGEFRWIYEYRSRPKAN